VRVFLSLKIEMYVNIGVARCTYMVRRLYIHGTPDEYTCICLCKCLCICICICVCISILLMKIEMYVNEGVARCTYMVRRLYIHGTPDVYTCIC